MPSRRFSRFLLQSEREEILKGLQKGISCKNLAYIFNVTAPTIYNVRKQKFSHRTPCGGRPKSTSKQDDDHIRVILKKHCLLPLRHIQRQFLPEFSIDVLRRRMKEFGLHQAAAKVKPALTAAQKHARLAFAKENLDRPISFWRSVYFADETMIRVAPWASRPKVICGSHFPRTATPTIGRISHPKQLLCWFAIKHGEPVKWSAVEGSMNSTKFVETIKTNFERELRARTTGRVVIIQDNAPCHVSRTVRLWNSKTHYLLIYSLQSQNQLATPKLSFLQLPPISPDLNVIENLFAILKRKISLLAENMDLESAIDAAVEECATPEYITSLVDSMPRRLAEVIKRRGSSTEY